MSDYNHRTRIVAATLGTLLGLAGCINHGIFEILQGNAATGGFFIEAISEDHRFWTHGTEGAVTLIPNFLFTGIAVVVVGLAVIAWSLWRIHTRHGAAVFLLLMLALTLVGGGIGHVALFLPTWGYATRIDKPLTWWRRVLPPNARRVLAALWMPALVLTALSWGMVMELGIFGYFPGQTDPDVLLNTTLGFVLLTVALANVAFVSAMAGDIERSHGFDHAHVSVSPAGAAP